MSHERNTAQQRFAADRLRRGYARTLRQRALWLLKRVLPESAAAETNRWAATLAASWIKCKGVENE